MGRKNHNWDPGLARRDGDTLISQCRNCGLTSRSDYFELDGRVYSVIQWSMPDGRLLAVRPVVDITAPQTAPPFRDRFDGVPVTGTPECPKDPAGWSVA